MNKNENDLTKNYLTSETLKLRQHLVKQFLFDFPFRNPCGKKKNSLSFEIRNDCIFSIVLNSYFTLLKVGNSTESIESSAMVQIAERVIHQDRLEPVKHYKHSPNRKFVSNEFLICVYSEALPLFSSI